MVLFSACQGAELLLDSRYQRQMEKIVRQLRHQALTSRDGGGGADPEDGLQPAQRRYAQFEADAEDDDSDANDVMEISGDSCDKRSNDVDDNIDFINSRLRSRRTVTQSPTLQSATNRKAPRHQPTSAGAANAIDLPKRRKKVVSTDVSVIQSVQRKKPVTDDVASDEVASGAVAAGQKKPASDNEASVDEAAVLPRPVVAAAAEQDTDSGEESEGAVLPRPVMPKAAEKSTDSGEESETAVLPLPVVTAATEKRTDSGEESEGPVLPQPVVDAAAEQRTENSEEPEPAFNEYDLLLLRLIHRQHRPHAHAWQLRGALLRAPPGELDALLASMARVFCSRRVRMRCFKYSASFKYRDECPHGKLYTYTELVWHCLRAHHANIGSYTNSDALEIAHNKTKLVCVSCDFNTPHAVIFMEHVRHHVTSVLPYQCSSCCVELDAAQAILHMQVSYLYMYIVAQ